MCAQLLRNFIRRTGVTLDFFFDFVYYEGPKEWLFANLQSHIRAKWKKIGFEISFALHQNEENRKKELLKQPIGIFASSSFNFELHIEWLIFTANLLMHSYLEVLNKNLFLGKLLVGTSQTVFTVAETLPLRRARKVTTIRIQLKVAFLDFHFLFSESAVTAVASVDFRVRYQNFANKTFNLRNSISLKANFRMETSLLISWPVLIGGSQRKTIRRRNTGIGKLRSWK